MQYTPAILGDTPAKHQGRKEQGPRWGTRSVPFWSCCCVGPHWSNLFIVQSNSVASDPKEIFPFHLSFNKELQVGLSSVFSLYGQKCLKSPRTFLVKPRTSRLWPVLGIPGATLACLNSLPKATLYLNRKWALVILVTDSSLFKVLVTVLQKIWTNIFKPPCQGQEEIFKWSQVYNTFYLSFVEGQCSIKMIRKAINGESWYEHSSMWWSRST